MLRIKPWFLAMRFKTLPAIACPILVASFLAWKTNYFQGVLCVIMVFCALLLQIFANFCNDFFDYKKGADTEKRLGPIRVVSAKMVSPKSMLRAIKFCLFLITSSSIYLILKGGLPIFIVGIVGMLVAFLYTAGPYPLAYHGLGDITVWILFGPVVFSSALYMYTHKIFLASLIGLSYGFFSLALLCVNNIRDYEEDRQSGKRTMIVRFGVRFGKLEYSLAILGALIYPTYMVFVSSTGWWFLFLMFLGKLVVVSGVLMREGANLNRSLADTSLFMVVFSVGLVMFLFFLDKTFFVYFTGINV